MEFSWSEEQLLLRQSAKEFAERTAKRDLVNRNRVSDFDRSLWEECAKFGLLGLPMPVSHGGRGLDAMSAMLAMEGFGVGCRDHGLSLGLNAQLWTVQMAILKYGTEQQQHQYLPGLIQGLIIGAQSFTEPEAGSDLGHLKTRAIKTDGGYILNGHKIYITLGPVADVVVVYAQLGETPGRWGLTSFLLDTKRPGCHVSENRPKMGLRTLPFGDIELRDCFVEETSRLGPERGGAAVAANSLEWERSCMLACQLGAMERQLAETSEYARTRNQFGQAIRKFQSVSNRLAEMKLRLEASRWMVYHAAWLKQTGQRSTLESAMAKLSLTEAWLASSLDAMRVQGARGYVEEFEVERELRDAAGGVIYGGTSDIQRNIIAGHLGV
ncbi:MAG: acyl-CoA dehydrogenase family protein [Limisphaerales bacterium]|jgi:alkylation response protein AidB-like acyl-CoA dehydrogenase